MKSLYKALADFQQEIQPIYKGTQGYSYKYADWGQILEAVNPLLKKHNLGFTQIIEGTNITTHLFHTESGESINGTAEVPQGVQLKGMNDFQVLGSGITYIRRYALSAMLGLVTDEDADAAGEQVKETIKTTPKAYTPSKDKAVTDQQKVFIANLLRQKGIEGKEAIQEYLADTYGILPEAFMSQADAQMVIDDFKEDK